MNPRLALLLIPLGFAFILGGAAFVFASQQVAGFAMMTEAGSSENVTLRAGQLYAMQVWAECDPNATYHMSLEFVDAGSNLSVLRVEPHLTDTARGCSLSWSSPELSVPATGAYAIRWTMPPALVAKHPRLTLGEIPMVGGVSVAWFVLAGVFLAVGAPVLTLVLVRRERKREAARAEVEDSVRMAAKVAEAQPASGAATEAAEPRKGE